MNTSTNGRYVSMATAGFVLLVAQIAITRLLAAAIGSHATFAVLGFVMLGLAMSGTRVFVDSSREKVLEPHNALARGAVAFAAALAVFVGLTAVPFIGTNVSLDIICGGVFVFPFYYVGYFITLVLQLESTNAPKLYAADLSGAAAGAIAVVWILDAVSPQVALIACGALCAFACVVWTRTKSTSSVLGVMLILFCASVFVPELTRIRYASTTPADVLEWDKWDHMGHVAVLPYPEGLRGVVESKDAFGLSHIESGDDRASFVSLGWAMSREYRGAIPKSKYVRIDSGVGTPIVGRDALESGILTYDVTAAPFAVPASLSRVGIVGTGGGRDILAARSFGATEISAFEINPKVVEATEIHYRRLSGGPYSMPGVQPFVGDARSEIRGTGPFQVVVLPMTDTFSASSSGTLVFSENALYTVEAFRTFFRELDDDGLLSVSRFYDAKSPGEIVRIVSTAREAVRLEGGDPTSQLLIVYSNSLISNHSGIANVLVKRRAFSEDEIARVSRWGDARGFEILYPAEAQSSLSKLVSGEPSAYAETFLDVSPIWDDRPFFYDSVKPVASIVAAVESGDVSLISFPVRSLLFLFVIIAFAAKMLVLDPVRKSEQGVSLRHWTTPFFMAIGAGFLLIELAVLQRSTLFLGHPTYALTVVLSSLLIASALGSALSNRFGSERLRAMGCAVVLVATLVAIFQPWLFEITLGMSRPVRMLIVVATVCPLGITMGMLYPTALRRLAKQNEERVVPWCWAVNGGAGVLASIGGMFIAMRVGYTILLACGIAFYIVAAFVGRKELVR